MHFSDTSVYNLFNFPKSSNATSVRFLQQRQATDKMVYSKWKKKTINPKVLGIMNVITNYYYSDKFYVTKT